MTDPAQGLRGILDPASLPGQCSKFLQDATDNQDVSADLEDVKEGITWKALIICFLFLFFRVLLSFFYDQWWQKQMAASYRKHDHELTFEGLLRSLVSHFAPSLRLESYQFKGISPCAEGVSIEFEDLRLTVPGPASKPDVVVLDSITGKFDNGNLIAIMGPSGSGKTSFMSALCGRASYGEVSGVVKINGVEGNVKKDLQSIMGFVPQDDIVHEELTVREQIYFSAKLRNDPDMTRGQIENIVDDVVAVLQLSHIQGSIVGGPSSGIRGISGGQRKRVNIGLELGAQPSLLFLDEPTSGLDATSSMVVLSSLKKMTSLGVTIIAVIHQPRYALFQMFDQVLFLAKGGHTVFLGPCQAALPYFEGLGFVKPSTENPADWFLDVISGEVQNRNPGVKSGMLSDMWLQVGPGSLMTFGKSQASQNEKGVIDKQVVAALIMEEWDKIDLDQNGFLDAHELQRLLTLCQGTKPQIEDVDEMMKQIAPRHNGKAMARKDVFISFLVDKCNELSTGFQVNSGVKPYFSPDEKVPSARILPNRFQQFLTLFHREQAAYWRRWPVRLLDMATFISAALVLGLIHRGLGIKGISTVATMQLCLSLLLTIVGLRVFADQLIISREISSSIYATSTFLARTSHKFLNGAVLTVIFVLTYCVASGQGPLGFFVLPGLLIMFVTTSFSYILSATIASGNAVLAGVCLVLIWNGVIGDPYRIIGWLDAGGLREVIAMVFMTRWSVPLQHMAVFAAPPPPPFPNCTEIQTPEEAKRSINGFLMEKFQFDSLQQAAYTYETGMVANSLGWFRASIMMMCVQGVILCSLSCVSFTILAYPEDARAVFLCRRCQSNEDEGSEYQDDDDDEYSEDALL